MGGRAEGKDDEEARADQRLDKWLWHARLVKSRTLASRLVIEGKVRVNREKVIKPAHAVKPGDVITAAVHARVRVLRILALGVRRGPAPQAQALYEDLTPPMEPAGDSPPPAGLRERGSGRPVKRERRQLEALRRGRERGEREA